MKDLLLYLDEKKHAGLTITSEYAWETFEKSSCWLDIKQELEQWLIDSWEVLEQEDNPEVRGRIRCIREFLMLPNKFRIDCLEISGGNNGT